MSDVKNMSNIIEITICRFWVKTNWEKDSWHDKQNLLSINPRIVFTSKPTLQRSGKDPMLPEEKSLVVNKFKCYCESSYIGKTCLCLKTRIKEHVPKCVISHISNKKQSVTV